MPLVNDMRRGFNVWRRMGSGVLGQKIYSQMFRTNPWGSYSHDASLFARLFDFTSEQVQDSQRIHEVYRVPLEIHSITWFLPDFQHPFYGGIHTILRFASYLRQEKGIVHRFVVMGGLDESVVANKIASTFPSLSGQPVSRISPDEPVTGLPSSDVGIATLWGTAYLLLRFNQTKRKFYFLQDYEPLFYPAGSISSQVEATYRFGFYGIANTLTIQQIYKQQYGGTSACFTPCVDTGVFYPSPGTNAVGEPVTVFFYGRPAHPRNGFELGAQALRLLKRRLGDRIRVVAAGDRWNPRTHDLQGVVENLGLLNYEKTAELYRTCQVGLVMMFTCHPSYLPLELMASGCLVVSNRNPATTWLLRDRENCLLSEASATCLADTLEQAVVDTSLRIRIITNSVRQVQDEYSHWDAEIEKIYHYLCDPFRDCKD